MHYLARKSFSFDDFFFFRKPLGDRTASGPRHQPDRSRTCRCQPCCHRATLSSHTCGCCYATYRCSTTTPHTTASHILPHYGAVGRIRQHFRVQVSVQQHWQQQQLTATGHQQQQQHHDDKIGGGGAHSSSRRCCDWPCS